MSEINLHLVGLILSWRNFRRAYINLIFGILQYVVYVCYGFLPCSFSFR